MISLEVSIKMNRIYRSGDCGYYFREWYMWKTLLVEIWVVMLFCVIKMHNVINLAVELSGWLMQCLFILVDIIPDASVVKAIYLTAEIFFLGTSWLLQKRDQDLLLLLHSRYRPTEYVSAHYWAQRNSRVMLLLSLSSIPLLDKELAISRCY